MSGNSSSVERLPWTVFSSAIFFIASCLATGSKADDLSRLSVRIFFLWTAVDSLNCCFSASFRRSLDLDLDLELELVDLSGDLLFLVPCLPLVAVVLFFIVVTEVALGISHKNWIHQVHKQN